jgi:hypothetical protein
MSDKEYYFYMQACDINGNPITPPEGCPEEDKYLFEEIELETVFEGLLYVKCAGLNSIGKVKNIYTETYSDADRLRVYMPKEVKNEETVVTLTLVFVGEKRNEVRDNFNEYIRQGFHKYWDTARNKEFVFFVQDELPIGEEMWYGSTPYLQCDYKLQNIKGKTINKITL